MKKAAHGRPFFVRTSGHDNRPARRMIYAMTKPVAIPMARVRL
jgi:hypothetical protein